MGTKRQYEEEDAQSASGGVSGKRQKSYLGKKRKTQENSGAKKRARAIDRALRRNENLPANVRIDLERELASQRQVAEDKAHKKKRSAMISRYHMVRFFERKKAARLVKQMKRKFEKETDPAEVEKIQRYVHIAEVDEAYTQYFPHLETYVGLYSASVKSKQEEGDEESKRAAAKAALDAERPPMWPVIEKAMEEGPTALERLRDRRSPNDSGANVDDTTPPIRPRPSAPATTPASRPSPAWKKEERSSHKKESPLADGNKGKQPELNRRERRRLMRETTAAAAANKDDDDEDGSFFEEL